MKILWLAPFPLSELSSDIPGYISNRPAKGMWLVHLLNEFKGYKETEIHIVSHSAKVKKDITISRGNLIFHLVSHRIPLINKGYPSFLPLHKVFRYPFLKRKLRKIIGNVAPDLIHVHGTEDVYGLVPLITNIPVIVSIQGIINEIYLRDKTLSFFFQRQIETKCLKTYINFGCRTNFDKDFVKKLNPESIIHYLPEAINPIFFNVNYEPNEGRIINFVGTVSKAKGIIILIKAMINVCARFPEVKLNIIGPLNNRDFEEISELISNHNLNGNIIFHGFKTPKEILRLHLGAGLFVLPTLIDNSPNSLCEAMALGMPCIVSRVGGVPSLINDQKDGLLFEPGNSDELAEKISFLFYNIDYSRTLGKNAKKSAFMRNYPDEVAKTTMNVYKSIISKKTIGEVKIL
jgi:glycosyltransferase involved in cell wall biosynthesis